MERRARYNSGDLVFIPEQDGGFIPAEVAVGFKPGEEGRVRLPTRGNAERAISKVETTKVERMDAQSYKDVPDMITLNLLTNTSLLYNLKLRYTNEQKMKIYTNIGSILVAINPYMDLGLYNSDVEEKYLNSGQSVADMEPHIFRVAEAAFTSMRVEDKDQSCVITGESGAGKTETTKRFLQYVSEKSRRNKEASGADLGLDTEQLRMQILDSNPFMEAFGNAKTVRNDNSSRFGKLIEMFFETGKGVVVGARITNYLLEKSRVVNIAKGERNYHIFYQICAAASNTRPELKKKYHLQSADQFNYTMGPHKKLANLAIDGENDAEIFEETMQAMRKLKLTQEEIDTTVRICAGLLHLGNIEFQGAAKDLATLKNGVAETALSYSAELLGVEAPALENALVYRSLTSKVNKQHTVTEAEQARDALAKFVYAKLFDWLIGKMNNAMQQKTNKTSGTPRVLGVLDIFGFETFDYNSFEQMCINFCNEKLQAFFNLHVFKKEQKEYTAEGIDCAHVGFYDNQGVIDALENGPKAVMVICDDLAGLESATDNTFLQRILNNAVNMKVKDPQNHFLFKPKIQDIRKRDFLKNAFVIKHFAGFVHYNVEGYLEKNKDKLRKDLRTCISSSEIEILAEMFPGGGDANPGRQGKYNHTLGTKFRHNLNRLMERLDLTTPQFVRTIKPNDQKQPGYFDDNKIFKQLNEAGLLEVCKIRQMGYPIKKSHKQFMSEYLCLDKSAKNLEDLCNKLKAKDILYGSPSPNWQIGKTKVFMRSEQAFELESRRSEALKEVLAIVQNAVKRWLFRSRIKLAIGALKKIRKGIRTKEPELLLEGISFFTEKGPLFAKLPVVIEGMELMKEFEVQLELFRALKVAMKEKDINTLKVKLQLAEELKLMDKPVVKDALAMVELMETEKNVNKRLNEAIGSQDVGKLTSAIAYATESGYGTSKLCKQAENMLSTLKERETVLGMLRKELDKPKEKINVDELVQLVERLRKGGCPDEHPWILEAVRKGEMILKGNEQREKNIKLLEKQLKKNMMKRDLEKLKQLVEAAIALMYNGPLVEQAMEIIQGLEQRQELLNEVSNSARVLREKSKLPDGVRDLDLVPLNHAIKTAEKVPGLELGKELQVVEGKKLVERMKQQMKVQSDVKTALEKKNTKSYYKILEKVQALGLQTREADQLVQKVREVEMIRAKSESINNDRRAEALKLDLFVPKREVRMAHMLERVKVMHDKDFRRRLKEAGNSRDLIIKNYYKIRADADYVSREQGKNKKMRAKFKHAYEENRPLTKSLIEMDDLREVKAIQISQMINKLADSLSGTRKDAMVGAMAFVVEQGIVDNILGGEIYVQLAKKLTANPNPLSKDKAWSLLCLCATYFPPPKKLLPYVLHFLDNSVSDIGLVGNYTRYTLAQISASMKFDPKKLKHKPGLKEINAMFQRPPVLIQLELVNGKTEPIPVPADMTLQDAAPIIRQKTSTMFKLESPEWSVFLRATVKPPKQTWKTRLENFYRRYKPENLANVDQILAYYKGHEQSLFNDLTSTANYGPEPTPSPAKKSMSRGSSSRTLRKSKSTNSSPTPMQELDAILGVDDDNKSVFSSLSRKSISSVVSSAASTISRAFRRVRGLSVANEEDLDVPNPTIAWPVPWFVHPGVVMKALYEQEFVPVLSFKRRLCKTRGIPDENLFMQLQRDFLGGLLSPNTEGENAKLSVIILCVKLLREKKQIPYGDGRKLVKAGLLKGVPKNLKRLHKGNEEWYDLYTEVAASKSNELVGMNMRKLQKLFFDLCVQFPTYGMSFFFAQVLKGSVKSYIARAQTTSDDGGVKVGINQRELAFFSGGRKVDTFPLADITSFSCDGTTFTLKVKKHGRKESNNTELGDQHLTSMSRGRTSRGKSFRNAFKSAATAMFGPAKETVQLYTLQPRELFESLMFFTSLPKGQKDA